MMSWLPFAAAGKIIVMGVLAPGDYLAGTDALAALAEEKEVERQPSPYLTSVAGGLTVAAILGFLG